eukprot:SAG22_NODE_1779_length_3600_cov_3.511568_2_plen_697_part_00
MLERLASAELDLSPAALALEPQAARWLSAVRPLAAELLAAGGSGHGLHDEAGAAARLRFLLENLQSEGSHPTTPNASEVNDVARRRGQSDGVDGEVPGKICPPGMQADESGRNCVPELWRCPWGEVRAAGAAGGCRACAETEEPNADQTNCLCKAGHFFAGKDAPRGLRVACMEENADWEAAAIDGPAWAAGCVPCEGREYECVDCPGGEELPVPLPGYQVVGLDAGQLVVFECPDAEYSNSSACLGGPGGGGRDGGGGGGGGGGCVNGTTGPLCHVCEPGFARYNDGAPCEVCPSREAAIRTAGTAVAAVLGGLVAAILLLRCICGGRRPSKAQSDLEAALVPTERTNNPLAAAGGGGDGGADAGLFAAEEDEGLAARASSEVSSRRWQAVVIRLNAQTLQIVIGFGQVVGQLSEVLDVEYPAKLMVLLEKIKTVCAFDFLEGLGSCLGLGSFYERWAAHIYGLPLVGLVGCSVLHCLEARRYGRREAAERLRSKVFVVVFLLYPTVCHWAFSVFGCRRLSADALVLELDYSVTCYDFAEQAFPKKYLYVALGAALVIVVVALGLPLYIWKTLAEASRALRASPPPAGVAVEVGKQLGLDPAAAVQLMQQVELGGDYGFLVNAVRPGCGGWELVDMVRKMLLVGAMVVCVPGSLFQLWVAVLLSLGFLAVQIRTWPYKLSADNVLKAGLDGLGAL